MKNKILLFLSIGIIFIIPSVNAACISNEAYIQNVIQEQETINNNTLVNASINWSKAGGGMNSWFTASMERLRIEQQGYIDNLKKKLEEEKIRYSSCVLSEIFQNGYDAYERNDYEVSIKYYEEYLQKSNDKNSKDYLSAINNLSLNYNTLWSLEFEKENFKKAIEWYEKTLLKNPKNYNANFNIWASLYNQKEYKKALAYYEKAYSFTASVDQVNECKKNIIELKDKISSEENRKVIIANAPSNDPLSGYQSYLKILNIPNAWKKVSSSKQVIVAVIDDGININHPDLTNSIWTKPWSTYGSSKIIDFVWDSKVDNLAAWDHGTMVAGIIGASTNNNEGIAGIAKNVKIMPLRVFPMSSAGAKEDDIINAITYAIDNGANIINLSLGASQFKYSTKYDTVIKRAFDKWIIVVIAAGNWDDLSSGVNGVNLSINPISPVCNNNWGKYSIGVFAADEQGYRTNWTNYGGCAGFMAPGVNIISTSIPVYNSEYGTNYSMKSGTSFSAPMISGIVALGYNKYGQVSPADVYNALTISLTKNSIGNYMVDASKYLDTLEAKIGAKLRAQNEIKFQQSATLLFNKLKPQINRTPKTQRKQKLITLKDSYLTQKKKLSGDNLVIMNYLIQLIEKEIKKY